MNVDRERTIREIVKAFSDVSLGKGKTIRQCAAIDDYLDPDNSLYSFIPDCSCWKEIPDSALAFIGTHGVFSYTGNDGVVFHLPAAMTYCLRHFEAATKSYDREHDVLAYTMICLEKQATRRLLSLEQPQAVAAFLEHFPEEKQAHGNFPS